MPLVIWKPVILETNTINLTGGTITISNELHASFYVFDKLPQATLQLHKCSDLSRCVPRSQKQPHHHAIQYSGEGRSYLLHQRKGSQHAARNTSSLQELLSGKSQCNSFQYLGTWLGKDPGSYLNPRNFPFFLLEL